MKVKTMIEVNCVNESSNTPSLSPDPDETIKPGDGDSTVTTEEDDDDGDIRPNE